mmetsp:Transcript_42114/g.94917  ORF Transcript_42114/g.94917 Transcript_42114/m.94917 type:complete len:235 (-) Transcript_42114:264-968(-)
MGGSSRKVPIREDKVTKTVRSPKRRKTATSAKIIINAGNIVVSAAPNSADPMSVIVADSRCERCVASISGPSVPPLGSFRVSLPLPLEHWSRAISPIVVAAGQLCLQHCFGGRGCVACSGALSRWVGQTCRGFSSALRSGRSKFSKGRRWPLASAAPLQKTSVHERCLRGVFPSVPLARASESVLPACAPCLRARARASASPGVLPRGMSARAPVCGVGRRARGFMNASTVQCW